MSIPVIIIEMAIFAVLFTIMCFKTTGRNNTTQVENYPPDIQEEYFKTHEQVPTAPLSKRVFITKSIALIGFAVILIIMALIAGAKSFTQGFLFAFGMMAWIGAHGQGVSSEMVSPERNAVSRIDVCPDTGCDCWFDCDADTMINAGDRYYV